LLPDIAQIIFVTFFPSLPNMRKLGQGWLAIEADEFMPAHLPRLPLGKMKKPDTRSYAIHRAWIPPVPMDEPNQNDTLRNKRKE